MNKVVKDIITYLLIAVLIVGILMVYFSKFAMNTILSKTYVLSKLEETEYYKKIYDEIYEDFSNYIMQSGLEESVLKDIITIEKIKEDTNIILDNFYSGLNISIDTKIIKEKLIENINIYAEENNLNVQNKGAIDGFCGLIVDQYLMDMNSHIKQDENIYKEITKVKKNMIKIKKIGFTIIAISLVLILIVNVKKPYRIIAASGIASTFMGSIFLILIQFINKNIPIENLYFSNEPLSEALRLLAKENVQMIYNYGIIMLVAGIIAIILGNLIESKTNSDETYSSNKRKSHKHRHKHTSSIS